MPKSVGSFLNEMFLKAGIKAEDQALKDMLANGDLAKINLPDSLVEPAEANLYTFSSAKANSKLRSDIFADALDGMDKEIGKIAEELNLDEATREFFKTEQSTFKKLRPLTNKIKELEAAKVGASKGEKSELQNEINQLKAAQSTMQKDFEAKLSTEKSTSQEKFNKMSIETMLSRYNYALGEIDPEVKIMTAHGVFQKALDESGAKVINDPETGRLKLVSATGTDFYDKSQNKKDLKSFLEGAIAPILSTTRAAEPGVQGATPTIQLGNSGAKQNTSAMQRLDAEIAQVDADVDA